jgi:hypothetical protein
VQNRPNGYGESRVFLRISSLSEKSTELAKNPRLKAANLKRTAAELPCTDHDHAVPTREYQLYQSSPSPATAAADPVLDYKTKTTSPMPSH